MRSDVFGGFMYSPFFVNGVGFFALWELVWKGLAMWRAARRKEGWWFVALMLINTWGILPIVYLLVWGKEEGDEKVIKAVLKSGSKKKKR